MEQFKFHEVVIGIIVGDVQDGDTFTTSSGFNAVYKNGVLSWVTQGGYIGSPVAVTTENIEETFTLERPKNMVEVTFNDALDFIKMGDEVIFNVDGREYPVANFADLDSLIADKEYFEDVYNGKFFVEATEDEMQVINELLPFEITQEDMDYIEQELVPQILAELEKLNNEGKQGQKKLSASDAYSIHHQYHFVKRGVNDLAEAFGVTPRMIYYVLDGTHWNEVYEVFHNDYDIVKDDYIK